MLNVSVVLGHCFYFDFLTTVSDYSEYALHTSQLSVQFPVDWLPFIGIRSRYAKSGYSYAIGKCSQSQPHAVSTYCTS